MNIFNHDWKFFLGEAKNAQKFDYNDRTWEQVDLPHDWVISQGFLRGAQGGWTPQNMQGFFAWEGICWYRKEFILEKIDGKAILLYFGGAYRNSTIFVNGKEAGKRANGYISFEVDITDFAKEGKNLLAVRLDNGCEEPDRWYSGSGLYRNVSLKIVPLTRIKTWGVQVKTVLDKNLKKADVNITTEIIRRIYHEPHEPPRTKEGRLKIQIIDPSGKNIKSDTVSFTLKNNESSVPRTEDSMCPCVNSSLKISSPLLWSAEIPNLYKAVIELLSEDDTVSCREEVSFGIRRIEIAYNKGMTVNGEKVKLKGVCLHHEAGITGSAYYKNVWRRRLNVLKSIGCNAIRTSHNPPAAEFLDLCDEMGFYVIDECFDKWKSGYYGAHFDEDAQRDLTDFIMRDRNHACVFMWSVGNEVENQGQDSMIAIQKKLVSIVRALDDRPVTCALSPHANPRSLVNAPPEELVKLTKKITNDVDVLGLNYHEPLYEHYTKGINKPIVGTECYEYYSSVGTNFEDICDKNPWQFVLENNNVIGQFIWAGIDYLGEAQYPSKGWPGSIIDICGFYKPNAFFRKSIWTTEPFIYFAFKDQYIKNDYARGRWSFPPLSSHLNHDYFQRRTVTAVVFTTCEEAQLVINDKKMGSRKKRDFKNGIIEWTFEYTFGIIEVKGFNNGKETCSYKLKTAEKAQKIKLLYEALPGITVNEEADKGSSLKKMELKPGEIAHIEVNITDKNGNLCPNEEVLVEFSVKGDARILGACSSDLNQNMGFTMPKVITSNGKALAIIKAGDNSGSNIEVCAYSEKLANASLLIKIK